MNKDQQREVDREVGLFVCRRMAGLTIGDIPDSMSGEATRTLSNLVKLPDNIETHTVIGRAIRGGLTEHRLAPMAEAFCEKMGIDLATVKRDPASWKSILASMETLESAFSPLTQAVRNKLGGE